MVSSQISYRIITLSIVLISTVFLLSVYTGSNVRSTTSYSTPNHRQLQRKEKRRKSSNTTMYNFEVSGLLHEKRIVAAPWDIPMPKTSHFMGFHPPTDEMRWNLACYQASMGEQVLLRRVLKGIKSPFDFIRADNKFRWVHRLADYFVDEKSGAFKKLESSREFRAPIVKLGHRSFQSSGFEGSETGWEYLSPNDVITAIKKHSSLNIPRNFVGIGLMDENWGWLSTYFLNRTAAWATALDMDNNFKFFEKTNFPEDEMRPFLDDDKLVMLLVNQHNNISHPKVISLPLGVLDPKLIWSILSRVIRKKLLKNKVINTAGSDWGARPSIRACVESRMKDVLTVSPQMNQRDFYTSLSTSMTVLCMPGLGYDTYRLWEVLALGSMPVLEKGIGFDRTLHRLPALLLEDFYDLTPALVREAYVEALYNVDEWDYERITHMWYERLLYEVGETGSIEPLLRKHPLNATDSNFCRPLVPFNCETMGGCGAGTKRTPKKSCAIDPSIIDQNYDWTWIK